MPNQSPGDHPERWNFRSAHTTHSFTTLRQSKSKELIIMKSSFIPNWAIHASARLLTAACAVMSVGQVSNQQGDPTKRPDMSSGDTQNRDPQNMAAGIQRDAPTVVQQMKSHGISLAEAIRVA